MTDSFHHFNEQQCSIIRAALSIHHTVLVEALWEASTLERYYDQLSELDALVDAYSHTWADRNSMSSVHDEAHILREKNRVNAGEKLLALLPDNDV